METLLPVPKNDAADDLKFIEDNKEFYIGLGLAITSCIFIGSSFIIKKLALIKLNRKGQLRASAGGFGYLKEWLWWSGLLSMGLGELANFVAFAFAPASLITPLGALSVLVTAVLSSKFLNENLNILGKIGCFLCIIGSTIIVLHSPKEADFNDSEELFIKMRDNTFLLYVAIITAISIYIIMYLGPRKGHLNVMIYITLCSAIGSLTVMSCKALSVTIRDSLSGKINGFNKFMPYFLIFSTVFLVFVQMNYLNKALDTFNASIVTPIYYVFFTSLVLIASGILFKEWKNMTTKDVIGDLCGFLVVIVAIILLNAFKDLNISLDSISGIAKPKLVTEPPPSFDKIKEDIFQPQIITTYGSVRKLSPEVTI